MGSREEATGGVEPEMDALMDLDGLCEECEDRIIVWYCEECEGGFCEVCFQMLHRKGIRATHKPTRVVSNNGSSPSAAAAGSGLGLGAKVKSRLFRSSNATDSAREAGAATSDLHDRHSFRERAKFIPLRLEQEERLYLRLVESAIAGSDYTAKVDAVVGKPAQRRHSQLKQIHAFLTGLVTAVDYKLGLKAAQSRDLEPHDSFLQDVLEIARRHKIMNPEKLRTNYGKMIYLMQDAVSDDLQTELGFHIGRKIKTVYSLLEEADSLDMLDDPLIETATREILPDPSKSRPQIQQMIKKKERAVETLKRRYSSTLLSQESIHRCLYSACDNDSYLNSNRLPVDKMIVWLKALFRPDVIEPGYNMGIVAGQDGHRLTHSHERQFNFALQSLTLWREIVHDMFRLWCLAEEDLLDETEPYALTNTGQGIQRVQHSPRIRKAMQEILFHTQQEVNWIGSSVIHLGDHNVPNALTFIDKYTQVSRILSPIITTLTQLQRIYEEDEGIKGYIDDGFGGIEKVVKDILFDFFCSAFNGSGADNFYDAGSCIDGRLTSAWNWCSQLSTKPFYPVFKLTGFYGFDGESFQG